MLPTIAVAVISAVVPAFFQWLSFESQAAAQLAHLQQQQQRELEEVEKRLEGMEVKMKAEQIEAEEQCKNLEAAIHAAGTKQRELREEMEKQMRENMEWQKRMGEAKDRLEGMEVTMKAEKMEAEKQYNKLEAAMHAADKKQRELREQMEKYIREAAERRKDTGANLLRERNQAERRRREMQEELQREQERVRVAEAARELFEANWRSGVPPGIAGLTREQIAAAKSSYLDGRAHIAFVGDSGTGKSTMVNSVRGFTARQPGAARVAQNECTRKIERYPDSLHPAHMWYDVPGAGTLDCPDWQYFMDKELYSFDALVVVFSDRITQNDLRVISNAADLEIPTFLVRSKSDLIIRNMEVDFEDESVDEIKSRYLRSTREYVCSMMRRTEVEENKKVYMVSREGVVRAVRQQGPPPCGAFDERELLDDLLQIPTR